MWKNCPEMGIHPRSPAVLPLLEFGVMSESAMGGCGFWYGRGMVADLEVRPDALGQRDLPEFPVDLVGRVLRPELEDGVDGLEHHLRPQLRLAEVEDLEVADEAARADAHDEAPLAELVEHGRVRRHRHRVSLRQVQHARAEADLLRAVDERGEEHQRRGDALAPGAEVLAHERFAEAQPVREDDGFLVFGEKGRVVAVRVMHGHGEHAELDGHWEKSPLGPEVS